MSKNRPSSSSLNLEEDVKTSGSASAPAGSDASREEMLAGYPGAALLVGPDGLVVCSNAKGAGLEALIEHEAAPEIKNLIDQARSDGSVAAGSVSLNSAKGEIVLEITVVPGPVKEGDEGGEVLVMARDMTMERNLRTALVESRQRYKDLVEVSSDFSWETDAEGNFIFVSPRGALGYKAEELINSKAEDFVITPEEFSPLPFVSARPLDKVEIWMRRKGGETACVILEPIAGNMGVVPPADGFLEGLRELTRECGSLLEVASSLDPRQDFRLAVMLYERVAGENTKREMHIKALRGYARCLATMHQSRADLNVFLPQECKKLMGVKKRM